MLSQVPSFRHPIVSSLLVQMDTNFVVKSITKCVCDEIFYISGRFRPSLVQQVREWDSDHNVRSNTFGLFCPLNYYL
jgi:hypothetical protein